MTDVVYGGFEWSAEKASRNAQEHLIHFDEAATVFDDPFFKIYRSEEHSIEEDRYRHIKPQSDTRSCVCRAKADPDYQRPQN